MLWVRTASLPIRLVISPYVQDHCVPSALPSAAADNTMTERSVVLRVPVRLQNLNDGCAGQS
jgi:hypothetical protein